MHDTLFELLRLVKHLFHMHINKIATFSHIITVFVSGETSPEECDTLNIPNSFHPSGSFKKQFV